MQPEPRLQGRAFQPCRLVWPAFPELCAVPGSGPEARGAEMSKTQTEAQCSDVHCLVVETVVKECGRAERE